MQGSPLSTMQYSNGVLTIALKVAACLLALALTACSAPVEPIASAPVSPPDAVTPLVNSAAESILRGYYEAREGGLFTACGETSRRRVSMFPESSRAALAQLVGDSDQPRFVVAQGRLVDRDVVELGDFELISSDAWNCESRFDDFIYGARGLDGFWSLEATPAAVNFVASPGSSPLLFAYQAFAAASDDRKFAAQDASNSIEVILRKETCFDRMTDTIFAHRAAIVANGKAYEGCAWRGRIDS